MWQPAPFQSPLMGLGSMDTMTPRSSQMRSKLKSVYSCSKPYQGFSAAALPASNLATAGAREFVGSGLPSGSSPGAWPVEDPS